jgi:hypothetical protein
VQVVQSQNVFAGGVFSSQVFLSGGYMPGKGRNFWLYRGRDRNLILQTLRDLLEIEARDSLERSGKKTTQISTRQPIFPDNVPGLPGAIIIMIETLKYDLSLVRTSSGGFEPLSPKAFFKYLHDMWPRLITCEEDE